MVDNKKADGFDLASGVPGIEGELRPRPKFADRISKKILGIFFLFVAIVVIIFLFALDNVDKKKPAAKSIESAKPASTNAEDVVPDDIRGISGAPGKGPQPSNLTGVAYDASTAPTEANNTLGKGRVPALSGIPTAPGGMIPEAQPATGGASVAPLTPEQQAANVAKQDRLTRMATARSGGLMAKSFDGIEANAVAGGTAGIADMLKAAAQNASMMGAGSTGAAGKPPGGDQDEKMDFIKNEAKENRAYHQSIAMPALSPNEVKIGTYIPMALEQSINSDLPGQITARVTEAVYDSITGCRLLIPAMSKVVGRYDSKVALGQGRMLVVWNSMIFPDGAELNLGSMQGYDTAGQAGLKSDVDNHYLRLIGLTFGMSMIGAGVQLSIPQPNPGINGAVAPQTPAQLIATAMAQQYGQLGSQLIGKHMAVQPTLRNYAGERFMVMVPHTIVFGKVWRNRCTTN